MTPAFMGLLGVTGTLPLFYTEALAQRELYQKDFGARAFMDIFSHRAVAMFYDAWRKHRLPFQYEAGRTSSFLPMTLSLAGMAHGHQWRLPGVGAVAPYRQRRWRITRGGHSARNVVGGTGAGKVLQDYFRVSVRIEQFVGRWYQLPEAGRLIWGSSTPQPEPGCAGYLGHVGRPGLAA